MSNETENYDDAGDFYDAEPAAPEGGLVGFAKSFVEADNEAQANLEGLVRTQQILETEYANASDEQYDDGSDFYDEQAGSELDPFADDFQQQLDAHVDQRLAGLQTFDPIGSRLEWNQQRTAQQAAVQQQQEAEALARGSQIAAGYLEEHDARHFPMPQVLEAASAVASAWGMTPDVIAGLSAYERERIAGEAIRVASEAAGRASVQQSVLSRFGKRGGR